MLILNKVYTLSHVCLKMSLKSSDGVTQGYMDPILIQIGRYYGLNLQLSEVSGTSNGLLVVTLTYVDSKARGIIASGDQEL